MELGWGWGHPIHPIWADSGRRVDVKRKLRGLLKEERRWNNGQMKIIDIYVSLH